jgi:glutathione S-transferase
VIGGAENEAADSAPAEELSMIRLYDNPFSPFARKVRMVLRHKGIPFESVDALAIRHEQELARVNRRAEVPVLDDDGFTVVNSANIVAYLEDRHPEPALFPADPKRRAAARSWERMADSFLDAVIHDVSIWLWPTHQRKDSPPEGLLEAGRRDLSRFAASMESALGSDEFLCGELTAADLAVFPHLSSLKPLGVALESSTHPALLAWNRRMRSLDAVRSDLDYVKAMAVEKFVNAPSPYEGEKIVWRGDRIEWLLARGFHEWWLGELQAGRAVIPSWI